MVTYTRLVELIMSKSCTIKVMMHGLLMINFIFSNFSLLYQSCCSVQLHQYKTA